MGVLGNDSDPDAGDTITVSDARSETLTNGDLTLYENGSFTYAPDAGFSGTDSFTYLAVDNQGETSNVATVTINVKRVSNMACSDYNSRRDCNNAPEGCTWDINSSTCVGANTPTCEPTETTEVTCTGGIDEDCDGAINCNDSDCSSDPAWQTTCDNDGVCDPGEDCLRCEMTVPVSVAVTVPRKDRKATTLSATATIN